MDKWSSKAFMLQNNKPGPHREMAIVNEILKGNHPSWMFKMVKIPGIDVEVTRDYLCVGTDDDFVRVPLTPYAAQFLATKLGYTLPTVELVKTIWVESEIKLDPRPTDWYKNESNMRLGSNYWVHSETINHQMDAGQYGTFVAGHKKDVISDEPLLKQHPYHVVIYGWQRLHANGKPIQNEVWVHEWTYEDYSHGIRFVKETGNKGWSGRCCLWTPPNEFKI